MKKLILIFLFLYGVIFAKSTPVPTLPPTVEPTPTIDMVKYMADLELTPVPTVTIRPFTKEQLNDFKIKGIPTPDLSKPYIVDEKNKKIIYDSAINTKVQDLQNQNLQEE